MTTQPIVASEQAEFDRSVVRTRDWSVYDIQDIGNLAAGNLTTATSYFVFEGLLASTTPAFDVLEARLQLRTATRIEQQDLARRFAMCMGEFPYVQAVWASWDPELMLTVVVSERDMKDELRLFVAFRRLARDLSDPTTGDLSIVLEGFEPDGEDRLYPA